MGDISVNHENGLRHPGSQPSKRIESSRSLRRDPRTAPAAPRRGGAPLVRQRSNRSASASPTRDFSSAIESPTHWAASRGECRSEAATVYKPS